MVVWTGSVLYRKKEGCARKIRRGSKGFYHVDHLSILGGSRGSKRYIPCLVLIKKFQTVDEDMFLEVETAIIKVLNLGFLTWTL